MSMTFTIFSAKASPSDPPKTVKSCENTNTRRPSMVPCPVTTPSPYGRFSIIPKFGLRCWTNASSSTKEFSSSRAIDPLAGEHLALGALPLDRRWSRRVQGFLAKFLERFEALACGVLRHGVGAYSNTPQGGVGCRAQSAKVIRRHGRGMGVAVLRNERNQPCRGLLTWTITTSTFELVGYRAQGGWCG